MAAAVILLSCLVLLHAALSDAAGGELQALDCSTAGNYSAGDAYAASLHRLLAAMAESIDDGGGGGFFKGAVDVGQGSGGTVVYGLAMCSAGLFSRGADGCKGCLTAGAGALVERCPGSTTAAAMLDRCLLRYSDRNFFGTADTDIVFIRIGATSVSSSSSSNSKITYSDSLRKRFAFLSAQAAASPERLAASGGEASRRPYAVAQCTRDLPSERCRACLEALSANASAGLLAAAAAEGELKSLSCRLRYSFTAVTTTTRRMAQSVDYSPSSGRSHGSSSSSMVVVIIGAVAAVVILVVLLVCFMRKRAKHPFGHQRMPKITETEMPNQQQKVNYSSAIMQSERRFSYAQLLAATDNFSPERKLGEGAFGAVYRGDLPPPPPTTTTEQQPVGVSVAVKRILRVNERALQDYENEIRVIGALSHPNLVPFVGSCSDNGELLLVYQLVRNRTLDYHLHGSDAAAALLTWQRRYKIALGMASALSYLHSNQPRVLHRDIKPGNVMLDEEFNAKVGDFGLVRIIPADGASCPMTVFGSSSYIDPEYCTTGRASAASDVYSFGAVLLEIASGDAPAADEFATSRRRNAVVDRFRALYAGGGGGAAALVDAADRRLNGEFDEEQMERLALVGLHCVQFDHRVRPSSEEVLGYLQGRLPVPPLEIKVPRRGAETSSTSRHQQAVHSLISIVE